MTGRLLTLEQAAEYLGCSARTIKRRVAEGRLPVFRDGRLVRVREADLRRYVVAHVERPTGAALVPLRPGGSSVPRGAHLWDQP